MRFDIFSVLIFFLPVFAAFSAFGYTVGRLVPSKINSNRRPFWDVPLRRIFQLRRAGHSTCGSRYDN
jgi:hypothetical protein